MLYEFASAENIGDRKEQQDRVLAMTHPALPEVVLAVVADGMGGHAGGALAAQSVVEAIEPMFRNYAPDTGSAEDWLKGMILAAHDRVASVGKGFNRDPRSTCVLALAQPGRIDWAHCGDSRLYLFRDGEYVLRSEDHSLVEVLLQQGKISEAEVLTHPERSKLFSSLGGPEGPQVATGSISDVKAGDTVLLCSDGLWAYFQNREMADLIGYRDLTGACDRLIGLARRRAGGSGDNLSVAMIRLPAPVAKPGLLGTLFGAKTILASPLEDARRFAMKYLRVIVGPDASGIIRQIESCKTADELSALMPQCALMIERLVGPVKAESFTQRALGLLEET